MHDTTDPQTLEMLAFNEQWHYALNVRQEDEAYLCDKTLRNWRNRLIAQSLEKELFGKITAGLAKYYKVDPSLQRIDSTRVCSNMAKLSRLNLMVDTIEMFLGTTKLGGEVARVTRDDVHRVYPALGANNPKPGFELTVNTAHIPRGRHQLRVEGRSTGGLHSVVAEIPVEVRDAAGAGFFARARSDLSQAHRRFRAVPGELGCDFHRRSQRRQSV
jgi:hypothetical protein